MTLQEDLKREEALEAKRERMLKLVVLIVSLIVVAIIAYGMSRPQKAVRCDTTYMGQGSKSLHTWGSCN